MSVQKILENFKHSMTALIGQWDADYVKAHERNDYAEVLRAPKPCVQLAEM